MADTLDQITVIITVAPALGCVVSIYHRFHRFDLCIYLFINHVYSDASQLKCELCEFSGTAETVKEG